MLAIWRFVLCHINPYRASGPLIAFLLQVNSKLVYQTTQTRCKTLSPCQTHLLCYQYDEEAELPAKVSRHTTSFIKIAQVYLHKLATLQQRYPELVDLQYQTPSVHAR